MRGCGDSLGGMNGYDLISGSSPASLTHGIYEVHVCIILILQFYMQKPCSKIEKNISFSTNSTLIIINLDINAD